MFSKTSCLVLLGVSAVACSPKNTSEPPHLPLDMGSAEYRQLLERMDASSITALEIHTLEAGFPEDQIRDLRAALALGERSLKWIEYINSFRDDARKIRLTSREGGLRGIPINDPSRYSPALIQAAHLENMASLDPLTKSILVEGAAFSENPALDDAAFVELGKKIDRNYQTAARWQMMAPYLSHFEEASRRDVRGFYALSRDLEIDNKLSNFESLADSEKEILLSALVILCRNSGRSVSSCNGEVEGARASKSLKALYTQLLPGGQSMWYSFFAISNARRDIDWSAREPLAARIPFRTHAEAHLTAFVKNNVEEEFVWQGFRLFFDLKDHDGDYPFVTFEPGVTPHVKGLGANHIVMDSNSPLTEWDVQWTIRHEFGHVLGMPDCYVEFYDSMAREMVNYQLDTTDLMCSRAGRMNERIFNELRRAYFR